MAGQLQRAWLVVEAIAGRGGVRVFGRGRGVGVAGAAGRGRGLGADDGGWAVDLAEMGQGNLGRAVVSGRGRSQELDQL